MKKTVVYDQDNPHLGGNVREGDDATYEPKLWDWACSHFGIRSVLDVGCGCGYSTNYFRNKGIDAIGLDGVLENVQRTGKPCLWLDIADHYFIRISVDMVWCCEVVEHIEETCLHKLLYYLSRGNILLMTHAFPDQGGHHHVNCKNSEYWIKNIEDYKEMKYMHVETELARRYANNNGHFARSGLVFVRGR